MRACERVDNVNVETMELPPSFLTTGLQPRKPELQTPIFTALKLGSKLLLCIPSVLAPGFHNLHCAPPLKLPPKTKSLTHTLKNSVHWYRLSRCGGLFSFCRAPAGQFDFNQNVVPPREYEWFMRYEDNTGMHQKRTFKVRLPITNTEPKTDTRYVP